jgi:hypothetical protein
MFKKKSKVDYQRLNGYIEGIIDVIHVLNKQSEEYGDLASINDMKSLINKSADIVIDKLLKDN